MQADETGMRATAPCLALPELWILAEKQGKAGERTNLDVSSACVLPPRGHGP